MKVRAKIILDIEAEFNDFVSDSETLKYLVEQDLQDCNFIVNNITATRICNRCGSKSISEITDSFDVYCKRCWKSLNINQLRCSNDKI